MGSKALNSVYGHSTELNINEEDLKKSKDPQNQHNKQVGGRLSNITDTERDSSRISLLSPENLIPNSRVYQDYIKTHEMITSMYIFRPKRSKNITELIIYDTESNREIKKNLDWTKTKITMDTKITQLPNGDLFCFRSSSWKDFRLTAIIDRDFNYHVLPPGKPGINSIVIYYNRSVYCFSSATYYNYSNGGRFDLDQKYWSYLSSIPESIAWSTNAIFNGNILISNFKNPNLWLYSIDIDSFSIIPYSFTRQIEAIINAGDRLYLIETDDFHWHVHESGIDDEFSWKLVTKLLNFDCSLGRVCSYMYNKEKDIFYILSLKDEEHKSAIRYYYEFNLNEKVLKRERKCRIF